MTEASWGPGYVIGDKYRLTSKLGEGGMGAVWRADHLTLNAPVAVKLLDPGIANTEDGLARFNREAQSAAALRGAHVVQTFDYGIHEGVPFIVMELLVGESLAEKLASKGPLPPAAVALLLKQVARAIGKAHQQGIVHRDLKPDNIFLVESDDDEPIAKVLDFGIAKSTTAAGGFNTGSKTRTGALLGTPYYMSPEQAQGTKEVDYRTDLWALAVIAFECLAGKRPFDSEALGDLLLKICAAPMPVPSKQGITLAGFDDWFARAASRDPAGRFGTANEMAKTFEGLLDPNRLNSDSYKSFGTGAAGQSPVRIVQPAADSLEGSEVAPVPANQNSRKVVLGATLAGVALLLVGGVVLLSGGKTTEVAEKPVAPVIAEPAARPPSPVPRPPVVEPVAAPAATEAEPAASAGTAPDSTKKSPAARNSGKAAKPSASAPPPGKPAVAAPAPASAPAPKNDSFDPLQMRR